MARKYCIAGLAMALVLVCSGKGMSANLPPYYGTVSLLAQPLPWTAEVSADFGDFLVRLGEKNGLDPNSVRVTTEKGEELATRFAPDKDDASQGTVLWNAPPKTGKIPYIFCASLRPRMAPSAAP